MLPIHCGYNDEKRYEEEDYKANPDLFSCNHWKLLFLSASITEFEQLLL